MLLSTSPQVIRYYLPLLVHLRQPRKTKAGKVRKTRSLKITTNKIYEGVHWGKRKYDKDCFLRVAGKFFEPVDVVRSYPVEIRYRFVYRSKPLDTTNATYMVKIIEDCLRSVGVIEEDDLAHVAQTVITGVDLSRAQKTEEIPSPWDEGDEKNADYVEITITPYGEKKY